MQCNLTNCNSVVVVQQEIKSELVGLLYSPRHHTSHPMRDGTANTALQHNVHLSGDGACTPSLAHAEHAHVGTDVH